MTNHRDYGLPKSVVGWIYNHSRKNYWRVAEFYELDDLIQDGLMIACKCMNRYGKPGLDIDEPHFCSLVKTAFRNQIGDILRKHRRVNFSKRFEDVQAGESSRIDQYVSPVEPEQELAMTIASLPDQLRKVVELHLAAPQKLRNLRVRLDGRNETLSERLFKLTGFPLDKDFETELRAFFWMDEKGLA